MRRINERSARVVLTLLLVAALIYFTTLATHTTSPTSEPLTLVMSASEVRALVAARAAQANGLPPQPVLKNIVRPTNGSKLHNQPLNFVVINNRVYHNYSGSLPNRITKWSPPLKNKPPKNTIKWPMMMELTDGAALLEVNYSNYQPEDREFLEERVGVMVERARQVRRECQANSRFETGFSHFVWDGMHTPSVVWCPNYKVASTTWMINFLKLAHFNDDNPAIPDLPPEEKDKLKYSAKYGARHDVVNDLYPQPGTAAEKTEFMKKSFRVIIVRHPFTRILSAYRDKMTKEHPLPPKFGFRKLQKDIIAKYRPKDTTETYPFPTFSEFVQYVIDFTANLTTLKQWKQKVRCWTPYWAQCGVCTNDYNVIMKLETMIDDERFLITLANFEELRKTAGEWRHLRNVSSSQAAPRYYAQLTRSQILDLYKSYEHDFKLFNYTIDEYLPLAKDNSVPA